MKYYSILEMSPRQDATGRLYMAKQIVTIDEKSAIDRWRNLYPDLCVGLTDSDILNNFLEQNNPIETTDIGIIEILTKEYY